MTENHITSTNSILEATRWRSEKSQHGGLGSAGYIAPEDTNNHASFLEKSGESVLISPPEDGSPFADFTVAAAWNNVLSNKPLEVIKRLVGLRSTPVGIDLDLGCLYELEDGTRGGLQAFGKLHGALESPPYIRLSEDERTGKTKGIDETLTVAGQHWNTIRRVLVYLYIYDGAQSWASVRPQIQIRLADRAPIVVTLGAPSVSVDVCAVATLENVKGGLRVQTHLEYFPGHAEMDRAFGYGLEWEQGSKD